MISSASMVSTCHCWGVSARRRSRNTAATTSPRRWVDAQLGRPHRRGQDLGLQKPNSRQFSLRRSPRRPGPGPRTRRPRPRPPRPASTSHLRVLQRLAQPDLLGELRRLCALIEPTGIQVFDAFLGARLDVAAVDPDGWRAKGAGLFGSLLVGNLEHLDRSVAAKLCADSLGQRDRRRGWGSRGRPAPPPAAVGRLQAAGLGWRRATAQASRDAAAGGHVVGVVASPSGVSVGSTVVIPVAPAPATPAVWA